MAQAHPLRGLPTTGVPALHVPLVMKASMLLYFARGSRRPITIGRD